MTTWNFYTSDGHYIGQTKAINAEAAFCYYMSVPLKRLIDPKDVKSREIEPDVCEINYGGEVYVLRAQ